jgi:hypothetical protein
MKQNPNQPADSAASTSSSGTLLDGAGTACPRSFKPTVPGTSCRRPSKRSLRQPADAVTAEGPERGHFCAMPLGFDPPHPGGMTENSPTFQRWVREFREAQVPKGRLKPCTIYQPSLRDLSCCGRWFPTLKRWAIIRCPSGTNTWPGSSIPRICARRMNGCKNCGRARNHESLGGSLGAFACRADGLITRNPADFKRFYPSLNLLSP